MLCALHASWQFNPLWYFGVHWIKPLGSSFSFLLCFDHFLWLFWWQEIRIFHLSGHDSLWNFGVHWIIFVGLSFSHLPRFGHHFWSSWRPRLGAGIRFGEASHPGPTFRRPAPTCCRFLIVNPTCLCKKQDTFRDLITETKSHVIAISETAATIAMQTSFNRFMVGVGFQNLWCPPVSPQLQSVNSLELERGKATGVMLSTSVPCRYSRVSTPADWELSTRIVHGVVQLGQSHVQTFVVYGRPSSHLGASQFNNSLLEHCLKQASLTPLPFVIMGDWNQPIDTLASWPELEQKGFRHLSQLHEKQFGVEMPPTCQGTSVIDSAIISPHLCGFVKNVQVLSSKWFATHSPVVFDIDLQGPAIFVQKFRLPKQLVEFSLDKRELENSLLQLQLEQPSTIEQWGESFEHVVEHALAHRNPPQQLPHSYRGRCKQ